MSEKPDFNKIAASLWEGFVPKGYVFESTGINEQLLSQVSELKAQLARSEERRRKLVRAFHHLVGIYPNRCDFCNAADSTAPGFVEHLQDIGWRALKENEDG